MTERVRVVVNNASAHLPDFSQAGVGEYFQSLKVPVLPVFPYSVGAVAAFNDGFPYISSDEARYGDGKQLAEHEIATTALIESLTGLKLRSREDRKIEKEAAGSLLGIFEQVFKGNKTTHSGAQTSPGLDPRRTNPF